MKAVICTRYGAPEVLQLAEVEKPVPNKNELLIKVRATTVHIGDTKIRRLEPGLGTLKDFFFKPMMRIMLGFWRPRKKILGMELAGEIEAVGSNVKQFAVGDTVFGSTQLAFGAYAEYTCLPEDGIIAHMPESLTFEEAAAIPNGALTALMCLRKGNIRAGSKVLIFGASGSVGTFAVQLAKHFGAEVTAVCSDANLEMVQSIGSDFQIDYKTQDFTQNNESYDLIFDAVGKIEPTKRKKSLKPDGVYLNILNASLGKLKVEDLKFLKGLCENGELNAVIDRVYPLDDIVEAHRYVDAGHKKGNVIVKV